MAATLSFGDLLRQHRLAAGLTQEALAERAGLSEHGIQKLERGVTHPHRDTVARLLGSLRLSVDDEARMRTAAGAHRRLPRVLSGADAARHNLPIPVTSFIGRDEAVAEVVRRLSDARLVTLTGVGGCGKTRLALEVARSLLDQHADGVWLVELAPVADPTLVPHLVADAVGVREGPDQTIMSALVHALRNRHLLLVVDNCEHLLDACARLVDDLVRACAHVQVLATSREALALTEEVAWRVPSLPVPDERRQLTLAEISANAAVQLFVQRAAAGEPRFTLTERNAAPIAQICRRLDGIPLSVELAAARAQALSPEQIAARLDERFRLLTGGSRAALPRQQTLRATLDWSYDLLTEAERRLLNRLSVFAGGWRLEAAEVVCADERIVQKDVLGLLANLVGKSLVLADQAGSDGDAKRYRLLETVRQYARERLLEMGEAKAMHERHAAYFLAFGEPTAVDVELPLASLVPSAHRFDALEYELDNLRAAIRWWIESKDVERAIQCAGVLFPIWFRRGYATEGHALLEEILALPPAPGSPAIRHRVLPIYARLALHHGEHVLALEIFEELVAAYQSAGNHVGAAYALIELANVHLNRAVYTEARTCLDAARSQGIELGDHHRLDYLWHHYACLTAICEGRYETARKLDMEWLAALDSEITPLHRAYSQMNLGHVDLEEGSYAHAREHFLDGLEVAVDYGDRNLLVHLLERFSGLASALGQHERAANLGGASEALREAAGIPTQPAWQQLAERWLAISRQALGEQAAAEARVVGRSMPLGRAIELCTSA
jgi:predicted ATPase/DNA-binding XRE family transcriptional regulator